MEVLIAILVFMFGCDFLIGWNILPVYAAISANKHYKEEQIKKQQQQRFEGCMVVVQSNREKFAEVGLVSLEQQEAYCRCVSEINFQEDEKDVEMVVKSIDKCLTEEVR